MIDRFPFELLHCAKWKGNLCSESTSWEEEARCRDKGETTSKIIMTDIYIFCNFCDFDCLVMTSGCFSQCLPYSARSRPLWNKAAQSAFKRSSRFVHLDAIDCPAAFSALWRVMKSMPAVLTRHPNLHLHSWACRENSPALPPGLKSQTWVLLS